MNGNNVTHFDRFGVEHIINEIKKLIDNKNITMSICRIQANDLAMCGCVCIGFQKFISFMLKGTSLLDYADLFSPNEYEKNDRIILKYLQ